MSAAEATNPGVSSPAEQPPGGGPAREAAPKSSTPATPRKAETTRAALDPRSSPPLPADGECVHCGLPLGSHHRIEDGPFCCNGCRTVYGLIHREGLERYYDLRRRATAPAATLRPDSFAWLEPLLDGAPTLAGGQILRLRLDVQGVHCAACVWLLEQLFARHAAGRQIRINPALGTVDVLWDRAAGDLIDYLTEVESFGYRFGPPHKKPAQSSRSLLIRMAICIAAAMNVMMFSLSYYLGLAPDDGRVYTLFGQLNLGLATVAIVTGGWPFMRSALAGLRRGMPHLDLPIALGMGLAFIGSTITYLHSGPEAAYFDTITIFVALMLTGRWLQERVLERNRNALLASAGIADLYTRRFRGEEIEPISASEIRKGDTLWIAAGDLIPVEGVLLRRPATISMDWITGEAEPRSCEPGATLGAGGFNRSAIGLRMSATEDFSASRLNDLMAASASEHGGHGERRPTAPNGWQRISTIYVTAVLVLAALGFVTYSGAGLRRAVEVSVAILVVTCPCALGLALPLGRELIHAGLRRQGILLRRDGFLDRALRVRQILFDKTGTLTRGQLRLDADSRRALLALPARERRRLKSMCSRSSHPVSRCVTAALALESVASTNGDLTHAKIAGKPCAARPGTTAESIFIADTNADLTTESIADAGSDSDSPAESTAESVADASSNPSSDADAVREEPGQGLIWQDGEVEYRFGRATFACPDVDAVLTGEPIADTLPAGGAATNDAATGGAATCGVATNGAATGGAATCGAATNGAAGDVPATGGALIAPVIFSADGRPLLKLALEEDLRPDAAREVSRLSAMGLEIHLLSGDVAAKVARVAEVVGIGREHAHGGLSPEEKAALVSALDNHDSLMVGDGLNDSLSFDAALCSATPAVDRAVLPQKTDFYFLGDGVAAVRRSLEAAHRLRRVQRDNLIFAALYNLVAVGLCLAGAVGPLMAAILMPASSVSVVGHTTHRLRWRPRQWTS